MLTRADVAVQLQDLALAATRIADGLDGEEAEPPPLTLAEAAVALDKLQTKLVKIGAALDGGNGKGRAERR